MNLNDSFHKLRNPNIDPNTLIPENGEPQIGTPNFGKPPNPEAGPDPVNQLRVWLGIGGCKSRGNSLIPPIAFSPQRWRAHLPSYFYMSSLCCQEAKRLEMERKDAPHCSEALKPHGSGTLRRVRFRAPQVKEPHVTPPLTCDPVVYLDSHPFRAEADCKAYAAWLQAPSSRLRGWYMVGRWPSRTPLPKAPEARGGESLKQGCFVPRGPCSCSACMPKP